MTEPRCLRCKEPEHMHGATDVAREHLGNDCAGFVAVLCGDALEEMGKMKTDSVDAVVTDPPYNVGKDFGNGSGADRRDDYDAWLLEVWQECGRVAKEGAFLIYTNRIAHLPAGMLCIPEPWRLFHIGNWHKPLALAGCWYSIAPHWEPVFFYVKGKPWRAFRSQYVRSDVFQHNVQTNRRGHPTEKPLKLFRELVEFACPPSGLVLDPFCGSGTTGAAAISLGLGFVGIDNQERWATMTRERLQGTVPHRNVAQAPLPLAAPEGSSL